MLLRFGAGRPDRHDGGAEAIAVLAALHLDAAACELHRPEDELLAIGEAELSACASEVAPRCGLRHGELDGGDLERVAARHPLEDLALEGRQRGPISRARREDEVLRDAIALAHHDDESAAQHIVAMELRFTGPAGRVHHGHRFASPVPELRAG